MVHSPDVSPEITQLIVVKLMWTYCVVLVEQQLGDDSWRCSVPLAAIWHWNKSDMKMCVCL